MAERIDLNADLGEAFGAYSMGSDEAVLVYVTSANVACGFHAGDPTVIDRTVARAVRAGVAVGAHPSHYDLRGFGRREILADPAEVEADVVYQVGAVAAFARAHGSHLSHVKPHGSLYSQAARDEALARAVARGVARFSKDLILMGLASSAVMRRAAEAEGLRFAAEAFADRAYDAAGRLISRSRPGALITDPASAAAKALRIVRHHVATSVEGTEIPMHADTLCLHGDNPHVLAIARAVRETLEGAGVSVQALAR
jgi:5-oxoprolinase (ATP-hydrolysing) subunit A